MKKFLLSLAAVASMVLTANATKVTFDFTTDNYGLTPYDEVLGNDTPYIMTPATVTQGDVTITLNGDIDATQAQVTTAWRMWTDGLREYSKRNPSFTVSVKDANVTGVEWTVVSGATFALEGTTDNITSWAGDAASVTFVGTASANKAVKTITVTYGEVADTPSTPETPEGTLSVSEALTLMEGGYEGSAVVKGIISSISEISAQYGNATYLIKDNLSDENGLEVFRGKYINGASFTDETVFEIGATVVVSGDLLIYSGKYEFTTGSIILSYTAPEGGTTPDVPEIPEDNSIFSESFSKDLGDFTIMDVILPGEGSYVWSFANGYGAKASAYVGGSNHASESWLISPVIDLANYKNVTLSFDQAVNYANGIPVPEMCKVFVGTPGLPSTSTWTNISSEVNYPEGNNWTFVNSGEISLAAFEGKKVQIGFLYTSTDAVSTTWEIKNFVVNGEEDTTAIDAIGSDVNAPVEYFNLQGVRVNNPSNGIFIIRQGDKTTKAVIR